MADNLPDRSAEPIFKSSMEDERQRYSQLMPLHVKERLRLSVLAIYFFSPLAYRSMCQLIEKVPDKDQIRPLDGRDFLSFLSKINQLADPNRYIIRIRDLLSQLASHNILTEMGAGRDPIIGKHYYFLRELTKREQEGRLWLARKSQEKADEIVFGSTQVNYKSCSYGVIDLLKSHVETDSTKVNPAVKIQISY